MNYKLDKATIDRILELRRRGQRVAAIAEATGISRAAIWQIWRICVDAGLITPGSVDCKRAEPEGDRGFWYCETCAHYPECQYIQDAKRNRAWAICRWRTVRTT